MEGLLTRPVVIGLAVAGGALTVAATLLRRKRDRESLARKIDFAGYVLMGISMLLFIVIGFRGQS
jgi:hypothetical protein